MTRKHAGGALVSNTALRMVALGRSAHFAIIGSASPGLITCLLELLHVFVVELVLDLGLVREGTLDIGKVSVERALNLHLAACLLVRLRMCFGLLHHILNLHVKIRENS